MDQLLQFAGRLHPLVLHAPIGLAIGLVLLELLCIARKKPLARDVRIPLAWLTALTAAAAVGSGLMLEYEGGHNADTVLLHKWLAIAVAVAALLAAILSHLRRSAPYAATLAIAAGLLIPAGHFGASMTHGDNFLLEPFEPVAERPAPPVAPVAPAPGATPSHYATAIAPILQTYCYGCHGAERDKGDLRLHTPEAILAGGEIGAVIVPGDPDASDLFVRMAAPLESDDHMPPKSKPQPTPEDLALLKAWIAAGAAFDSPATATSAAQANAVPAPTVAIAPAAKVLSAADPAAIETIRTRLAHVEPVARDSKLLLVDFSAIAPTVTDELVEQLLEPIRANVSELNLARTGITDKSLTFLAKLPNLRRLNLAATGITEAGIGALADHPILAELVLSQAKLTDGAFDAFLALPALTHLYVWNAGLTAETITELRAELPKVVIDAGDTPDAVALATETEVKFSNGPAAPAATNTPTPSTAELLKPVNTMCPVAGKPIEPGFALVHKGRVVGFCCRHCIASFLEDPAKYEDKIR